MNADAEIKTDDESIHIKTQTGTCTEGYLTCEIGVIKDAIPQGLGNAETRDILLHTGRFEHIDGGEPVPYITRIDKCRTEDFPYDRETEFEISFQLDISGMEERLIVFGRIEVTGSVGRGCCSTQTVRSASIERLGERCKIRVTKRYIRSGKKACSNADLIGKIELIPQFSRQFDKLVEGCLAQRFINIVPLIAKEAIYGIDEISGLFDAGYSFGMIS